MGAPKIDKIRDGVRIFHFLLEGNTSTIVSAETTSWRAKFLKGSFGTTGTLFLRP